MPTYELLNSVHGALPSLFYMDFKHPFLGVEKYCEALSVKSLADYLDAAVGRPEFQLPWIASVIATLRQANQLSTISETFTMTQAKLCRYGYLRKDDLNELPDLAKYLN